MEDEVILSSWLKMQLEDEGYFVCSCITTGEEAVEFVRAAKPDVILMDINLAGKINGIEAAEVITGDSAIPIIFMTGYDEPEICERAQSVNPLAILPKPVEIWDLKPIIDSIFD